MNDAAQSVPKAPDLPTGTLTFLMTDIEGSTPLWEAHPDLMRDALLRHDALFAETLPRHGGRLVKERGEGDALFAVFADPVAALAAAAAIQRALLAEPWPRETPLRVRMGLHRGGAELLAHDYYGPTINRCARIKGLGHGGQILLSAALADLVRERLPDGCGLRALGAHTLKGIEQPEAIYQLLHADLPTEFPSLHSPQAPRTNLPLQPSSFVGRAREQAQVMALLAEARLVTLIGIGGTGKTRLAQMVAGDLIDRYADGVWLVELAALSDPLVLARTVAAALGVREEPGRPAQATLIDHLKDRHALLLLDNCEHLVSSCAVLAGALLRACPRVRLLATSREGLEVAGEQIYPVPTLAAPDPSRVPPLDVLAEYEAVRLFVERAQARRPDFALDAATAPHVAHICARLDGLPLAIELAAARVAVLPVAGIAARLDDCFRLLTGGPRTGLPHHQTLRAALDWSHDLLDAPERVLFRRLAVFAGGWTIEAAEAVCAGLDLDAGEVLDLLGGLVRKSLALLDERGGANRYRFLEPVRQYAQERLAAAGEAHALQERRLAWCIALAERAEPRLRGPEQATALAMLEAEHDNLRGALVWGSRAGHAVPEAVRVACALWRFWYMRGYLSEGRAWLEEALAHGDAVPSALRSRALNGAGMLAVWQGDYPRAAMLLHESLALRRAAGDQGAIAATLNSLGNVAYAQGEYGQAEALFTESLALQRAAGDRRGQADALNNLGNAAYARAEYPRAMMLHQEALSLFRALGDQYGSATSLNSLGTIAYAQQRYGRAAILFQGSLAIRRALGDKYGMATALGNLASVSYMRDDFAQAQRLYRESLALCQDLGDRQGIIEALEALAVIAGTEERPEATARLFGAAVALREVLGVPIASEDAVRHVRAIGTARARLGADAFAALLAEGRAMPLEGAIALALLLH